MRATKTGIERVALAACLLMLAGCSPEAWLGSSDRTWLWIVVPLAVLLIFGSTFVYLRRQSQLEGWSLEQNSSEPRVQGIVVWTLVVAGVIGVLFSFYNFLLEIDPDQKLWNIGSWWLGTAMGVAMALLIGFKLAEPSSQMMKGRS